MPFVRLLLALAAFVSLPLQAAPNFVVIVTDDQRWDTLWATPNIQALANQGVSFSRAFSVTPWCGPSRASLYAGGYLAQNTKVVRNGIAFAAGFNDSDTIATNLQAAGYVTGFVGKYFTNYANHVPYVPPGWTSFVATAEVQTNLDWFDFPVIRGSTDSQPGEGVVEAVSQYITDFQTNEFLDFLDSVGDEPFFAYLSYHAPHSPNIPAPGDEELFSDFVYQDRAWGEPDLEDKPSWVQENAAACTGAVTAVNQLRSLQAVDRSVAAIRAKLEATGAWENTYFFFTSDNGYMWGEHQFCGKGKGYEEALRVPFILHAPDAGAAQVDALVSPLLDIGPTIYELAGLQKTPDGASLVPLLSDSQAAWRDRLLIQSYSEDPGLSPIWAGLRIDDATGNWKFVEHVTGEFELYDLTADPYEEQNVANDPVHASLLDTLKLELDQKRGLSIAYHPSEPFPAAVIGEPYAYQVRAWGGQSPLSWAVKSGDPWPDGLALSSDGVIAGDATEASCSNVKLEVTGSRLATHQGSNESETIIVDVCAVADNCSGVANPDQLDTDGDGFGNVCDADLNNDCIVDFIDFELLREAFFSDDPLADFNGDGQVNFPDLAAMKAMFFAPPGPSAAASCET